ncbi:type I-E CRISPR-associated protein Cse2/CasB [Micromonospora phytophila]|uniref:type I-E CRISPR-associated protein Cse2/CasB n=1 Tax=Micromonospora phytophila TaxID=709888 RepID=UPI00202DBDF5|nr:type I-E CRISPR-associated protein Cse2/CasB [Micromonospora phytophila]MCM0674873.1 type I-E CRISPR-associated protein Cse2/CasB [Micromonospora phytophila]
MTTSEGKVQREPSRHFWERDYSKQLPEGRDLAALRGGLSREAGAAPAMWPHYTRLQSDGWVTRDLRAEHAALALFAVHQQSQSRLMHQPNIGLGLAVAKLRVSGKFTADAVDKRFGAAATATSFTEVVAHLRGLVSQLRTLSPAQALDYTLLFRDLRDWQDQDRVHAVRRRWGAQYFTFREKTQTPAATSPGSTNT